ncbi:hypothetical protein F503_04285 [Ophiostoma piceae UAMH 11346]|uniref:DUF7907 domain-containing protein n=1 Tax=Ophiostoma piceae (strain UAMH 11346) TaxID=1262450 RepID=S3CQ49_OPHP1|nr:hypothetical protein F503_04285 [Ophiostoma piceae UAMH 11346]
MTSQPGEVPTEDSAGQRRRLQLRGTVFLLLGFVVLACFTGSASAWSDYFRYTPPPTRLYVYNIHVTDRLGDAMLHKDSEVASVATLGIGTEAHGKGLRGFYKVKFENPCVSSELSPKTGVEGLFGGLQPVSINLGYGGPSYRNAFFFDYNDLLWTDMVDPDKPSGFEGWVACITDRQDPYDRYNLSKKAIQLLYRPSNYQGRYPRECESVKLIRVPRYV